MKNIFLFSFLFVLPFSKCIAQSIYVEYEDKRSEGNVIIYQEAWITDSVTTYKGKSVDVKEIAFLKNKKNNILYNNEKYRSKDFFVKDSLHNFKWTLTSDTATILKRKCLSAKTTFRGREYKVFYAPEIPVSDGPWKLGGLPGLILEAKTTDDFVSWRAVKLDLAYKGRFKYVDISKNMYINWQEYVVKYKEITDQMVHKLRTDENLKGNKIKFKTPTIEIFYPEVQVHGIDIDTD